MSLSRFVESLSVARLWALGTAIVWIVFVLMSGGPAILMKETAKWNFPVVIGLHVVGSACAAALVVEVLRAIVPSGAGWSDAKHFKLVGVFWAILAALITTGLVLMQDVLTESDSNRAPESLYRWPEGTEARL